MNSKTSILPWQSLEKFWFRNWGNINDFNSQVQRQDLMTEYELFLISNKSFYKEARKAEEEEKAHEPGTDVAEEGNFFFYKSEEINSNWSTQCFIR